MDRPTAVRWLGESVIIILSVFVALAGENWREEQAERNREAEALQSIVEALHQDTAAFTRAIDYTARRDRYARMILARIVAGGPVADPREFLIGVEASARYIIPEVSRDVWDDLLSSGQLGLIRRPELRRRLARYYSLSVDPAQELWRNRVWYQYGPMAVRLLPLDVQTWAASYLGDSDAPADVSEPPDLPAVAERVLSGMRADPASEGLVKAVIRSNTGQLVTYPAQRDTALALMAAIEEAVGSR